MDTKRLDNTDMAYIITLVGLTAGGAGLVKEMKEQGQLDQFRGRISQMDGKEAARILEAIDEALDVINTARYTISELIDEAK